MADGHGVLAVVQVTLAEVEVGVQQPERVVVAAGITGHAAQGKDGIHVVAPHEQTVGTTCPGGIEQGVVRQTLVMGYQFVSGTQEARLVAHHFVA